MCGLTFIFDERAGKDCLRQQTERALDSLRYRGPDGKGLDLADEWSMGHRRLAIIDLEASKQPMWDPGGRFCLAYNGEVYNYKELRNSLRSKWSFTTSGDTEVVLAGLVLEGVAFLEHMEGMWAIALWDTKERRLQLIRDRMGKKPLYYRECIGGIACASELPALKALSPDCWEEDLDSTADYLRYGYQLPGYTAYRKVYEVLPGHVLSWAPSHDIRQESYWCLSATAFTGHHSCAIGRLRDALINAVDRRLVADVEVGAFLSGGIDSSLIAGIVRSELGRPLKSFTIGFEDVSYDERQFARIAAEALGTEHYENTLRQYDEKALENLIIYHLGQPFADSSLLPTALVSQVAARKVKVALSGDGGDELFSGYERYQARMIMRWYTRLPKLLRSNVARLIRSLPEPMVHHSRSLLKKAHLFVDVADRQEAETPYFAPFMISPRQIQKLAPDMANRGHPAPKIPETTTFDDLQRMMLADACVYLPQDILVKVDRASMAHSLEARAPFLDRSVVELAFSMPRLWHRHGFTGKLMLRDSFCNLLPDSIWNRRKQGFGVPIHEWFRSQVGEQLRTYLTEDSGPFQSDAVLAFLREHQSGGRDHGYRLWPIYVYLLWRAIQV